MTIQHLECPLCQEVGGELLLEDDQCRVVLVGGDEGKAYPGYCRVIWKRHVREMSDLSAAEQGHLLDQVLKLEQALQAVQRPDKINLASLGNVVPHLHWHVIPRWRDDSHFPQPIWAAAQRVGQSRPPVDAALLRKALTSALKPD